MWHIFPRSCTSVTSSVFINSGYFAHLSDLQHQFLFQRKSQFTYLPYTKVSQNFFLLQIYYVILWTYLYFSASLRQLQQNCTSEKQGQLSPSCTTSSFLHFFDNFVIIPKPVLTAGVFEGSKEFEIWGSKIWAVWWWGGKFHPCFHLQRTSPYHTTFKSPCAFARKLIFSEALQ